MEATMLEGLWFMLIGGLIGVLYSTFIWMRWIIKNNIKGLYETPSLKNKRLYERNTSKRG